MKSLRPYQSEAVEAVLREWQAQGSTLLVLPTGCGKTLTAAEILKRRRSEGRVLWLAHREELITQAAEAIEAHTGMRCGIEKAEERVTMMDLFSSVDVVVASVQSLQRKRLRRFDENQFATVVIDEAHHAPAKSYRSILGHFEGVKVLGLTATPDRGDAVGLGNVFETCAYRYEIRRAIAEGYLAPILQKRIECADLDLSTVRTVAGDLQQGELEARMSTEAVLHQVASPLVEQAGERPTILFCAGVDQARAMADVIGGYVGPGRVTSVDGSTPKDLRAARIDAFREGHIQFLTNCAIFTEGFDAPETACIAIARPTKSRALYAQMIGRGTRIASGKTDCLVLDFVGNAGKHTLMTPLDVLAGRPIPEDVRRDAERFASEGLSSDKALEKAEEAAREREKRAEEQRRRQARIKAEVAYRAQQVDPFNVLDVSADSRGPRATDKQLEFLESMGVKIDKRPSRNEASKLIDRLTARRRQGLCTFKQARLLAKHGLPTDLTFREAGDAIDAIASNGWRAPQWLIQQHQVREAV